MLVGGLVGVFVHRSTITQAVLVLASFTSTFGLGWGAVTLIELAIGFFIGNSLFGRHSQPKKPPTKIRTRQSAPNPPLHKHATTKPILKRSNSPAHNNETHKIVANPLGHKSDEHFFVGDQVQCTVCATTETVSTDRYRAAVNRPGAKIRNTFRQNISGPAVNLTCAKCGGRLRLL